MPELPEVETIKNDLRPRLIGRSFTDATFFWERMVRQPSPDELTRRLRGQRIEDIARRGKYLIFRLSGGEALVLHLRMSGSLLLTGNGGVSAEFERYTRAVFTLDNGMKLRFIDRRKLGTVSLVEDESVIADKLGPEPLDPGFTAEVLAGQLSKHKAPLKAVLCDQAVIAGIGNMYADESLFHARLHPLRKANSLTSEEIVRLHRAIHQVLERAIGNGGASVSDYFRPGGELGSSQSTFAVAHRGGQPCPVCHTPIVRIPLRNRGTYFCPRCQATYS